MSFANVGTVDRLFRLILGAILIALPFVMSNLALPSMLGIVSLIAGIVLAGTAVIKFCPIYGIFGLRTLPKE